MADFWGDGVRVTGDGLCQVVAVVLKATGVGAPIAIDLDEELKEDFALEEILDVTAGQGTYSLQRCTGFADDDALLGFAFAIDHSTNVQ